MLFNLTSNKDYQDMNFVAYDAINSYISEGYHIDVKESIIDHNKDKNCIFKAVLKKEADNSNYKVAIKIRGFEDDSNAVCIYSKVETVDNTKLNEETRSFSLRKYDVDSKFKRLSDVINIVDSDADSCKNHIKIDSHESADDIYNKIVSKPKNDQKSENKVESCVDNANIHASSNTSSDTAKQNDDDFEDSIVRLIHYLCNELVIRQWC